MRRNLLARWALPALLSTVFVGCGGGGGGSAASTDTASAARAVSAAVTSGAPASSCPNGGITVTTGVDANGNGALDPSEVANTQYVCNGTPGTSGVAGSSGANALVKMSAAAGHCT